MAITKNNGMGEKRRLLAKDKDIDYTNKILNQTSDLSISNKEEYYKSILDQLRENNQVIDKTIQIPSIKNQLIKK